MDDVSADNLEGRLSRRALLRAAGGITFLALVPLAARGCFASTTDSLRGQNALLFTAKPYLQPGAGGALIDHQESVVLAWQTEDRPAVFTVEYGLSKRYGQRAEVTSTLRTLRSGVILRDTKRTVTDDGLGRRNYAAVLEKLALGKTYFYRVTLDSALLAEGYFATRKSRDRAIRFVAFGDNSNGSRGERAVAFHAYTARPDFIMNTGDNVYNAGLDHEYASHFFPVYNADMPSPATGAPLLRSVPFYTVLGNHDVSDRPAKDTNRTGPECDFDKKPGSLGYFTNMHLPDNGPQTLSKPVRLVGETPAKSTFLNCAGNRYPSMANYTYDYGDAHFLCLDSNIYVDPDDKSLLEWIESDLSHTTARWKFVVFHHPPFNIGKNHYAEQHMRRLCPLLERCGVDMVLSGHEHNYQRTRPMKFDPDLTKPKKALKVPGTFTIDRAFDGVRNTRPDGIIYLTTGAGGNNLYEPELTDKPQRWTLADDNHVDYVATMVSDRHSFTLLEIDKRRLMVTQIDEYGQQIDKLAVTKGAAD